MNPENRGKLRVCVHMFYFPHSRLSLLHFWLSWRVILIVLNYTRCGDHRCRCVQSEAPGICLGPRGGVWHPASPGGVENSPCLAVWTLTLIWSWAKTPGLPISWSSMGSIPPENRFQMSLFSSFHVVPPSLCQHLVNFPFYFAWPAWHPTMISLFSAPLSSGQNYKMIS